MLGPAPKDTQTVSAARTGQVLGERPSPLLLIDVPQEVVSELSQPLLLEGVWFGGCVSTTVRVSRASTPGGHVLNAIHTFARTTLTTRHQVGTRSSGVTWRRWWSRRGLSPWETKLDRGAGRGSCPLMPPAGNRVPCRPQGSPPPDTPRHELGDDCGRRHSDPAPRGTSQQNNWPVGDKVTAASYTLSQRRL